MGWQSSIEWTESTWNPVTGCSKISSGCENCYAARLAKRLQAMGNPSYARGFDVALHDHILEVPLRWKKPQMVFVNSMSDLFHERVPQEFILRVFEVMNRADWHVFQILTKRPKRLLQLDPRLEWAPNIWMGVTVEEQDYSYRLDNLRQTGAFTKFISLEPLLGPMHALNLDGTDWVIVGGESGPGARPMAPAWVRDILARCQRRGLPFFFKQWGGTNKKKAGRRLDGRTWDEMPPMPQTAGKSSPPPKCRTSGVVRRSRQHDLKLAFPEP